MQGSDLSEYEWIENELPKVKRFFRKISKTLQNFADSHNLLIEKYYHYIPGWEFLFKHPAGGRCSIEVLRTDDGQVTIGADWTVYEHEAGLGFDKHTERMKSSIDGGSLSGNLENMFQIVMAWTRDDLTLTSKRSPEYPEQMSKEEIERDMARYPEAIL